MVILNILNLFLNLDIACKNTHVSQADGALLQVTHFVSSVYKYTKHFGLSFANNVPKIWNDLLDDVRSATSLLVQKIIFLDFFAKAYPS